MIKKYIGYIFAIAVIVVVVFVVLGAGTYTSMLPEDLFTLPSKAEDVGVETIEALPVNDTLAVEQDSVKLMNMAVEVADTAAVENW